uniref:Chalcone--flavanone isomerase n=1 Tax=Gentiana triflora TaxID=55190 RepID=CFI_GENTR|nr:RecName: Full=Chalcone--flavanone isomerase; Short=Chalcone isomerase [Gentiana triflora]BAD95484.1 chalcone flavonone isomerase [Gentiana triflora]
MVSSSVSSVTEVKVESYVFPPSVKPPSSTKSFLLGGAGVRGLEINGNFVKFTAIGVYLEESGVAVLSGKWKGKTAEELSDSVEFFTDIITGPFEKFTQVTLILPVTGQQYSPKVAENCAAQWKAAGIYTDADGIAIEKFLQVFQTESFTPGDSILFTHSPESLTISFGKNGAIPEVSNAVIENKKLSEAVIESIIGEKGVSPAAKKSLATRIAEILNHFDA